MRDNASRQTSGTQNFTVGLTPVTLNLATPRAGSFHNATLHIDGTTSSGPGIVVTTTAALGAVQFLSTNSSNFSANFSLAGVPAGRYTLTVVATGSDGDQKTIQRSVVITSTAPLAYQAAFSTNALLPPGSTATGLTPTILAAEDDLVVYTLSGGDGTVYAYRPGANTNIALAPIYMRSGEVVIAGGEIYAAGQGTAPGGTPADPDCQVGESCIYRWSPITGAVTNVSAADPVYAASVVANRRNIRGRGRYVVWENVTGANTITLYDTQTEAYTTISLAANQTLLGSLRVDTSGGLPVVVYWASYVPPPPAQPYSTFYLLRWTQAAGSVQQQMHSPDSLALVPKLWTDGVDVVWSTSTWAGHTNSTNIYMAPLTGGAPETLATSTRSGVGDFRDGVVVWGQQQIVTPQATPIALKAKTAALGTVTIQDPIPTSTLDADGRVRSGRVSYRSGSNELIWNGTTGASTVRAEGGPFEVMLTATYMYFVSGEGIYRAPLN